MATGSWKDIRNFLKPRPAKQGRLRDVSGELMSSEQRADTMATYLKKYNGDSGRPMWSTPQLSETSCRSTFPSSRRTRSRVACGVGTLARHRGWTEPRQRIGKYSRTALPPSNKVQRLRIIVGRADGFRKNGTKQGSRQFAKRAKQTIAATIVQLGSS